MDREGPDSSIPQADSPSTEELPQFEDLDPASRIKHEVLEDVLVVTPRFRNWTMKRPSRPCGPRSSPSSTSLFRAGSSSIWSS